MRFFKNLLARFRRQRLFMVLLLTVVLTVSASLWLPQTIAQQVYQGDDNDHFNRLVDDYRKAMLELLGGFILVCALNLGLRYRETAEELSKAIEKTLALVTEGQNTDRMIKAISQLGALDQQGAKQIEFRLGGIYALERIARGSPDDHWIVMEVLSAYLRPHVLADSSSHSNTGTDEDIQAILTVLGRRQYKADREALNLRGTTLPGANIRGAHLQKADLSGACLERAALVEAHLEGATLINASLRDAQLTEAYLEGAHMAGADLQGAIAYRARLVRTELVGAHLQYAVFCGAQMQKADLTRASLQGAKLGGAHLEEAALVDAHLDYADLSRAYLHGANLAGAVGLSQEQIDSAYGDGTTQLPSGLIYPPYWSDTALTVTVSRDGHPELAEARANGITLGSSMRSRS